MSYDIIESRVGQKEWRFSMNDLRRIKTALRLQRDLEVNLAGVALVLDLLDQLKELETQMSLFEKHFL
jgi:chaperone modulatory protein CbpM